MVGTSARATGYPSKPNLIRAVMQYLPRYRAPYANDLLRRVTIAQGDVLNLML